MPTVNLALDQRFHVRSLSIEDAQACFEAIEANRAFLTKWMPWGALTHSSTDTRAFIEKTIRDMEVGNTWAAGVWEMNGQMVGHIGIHDRNPDQMRVEVGYWICDSVVGMGLATRATRAVMDLASAAGRIRKFALYTDIANVASQRIAEKLGFEREGTLRSHVFMRDGEHAGWRDMHVYGMVVESVQLV